MCKGTARFPFLLKVLFDNPHNCVIIVLKHIFFSCKTGGVKRSEKKQDKAGCRIKKLLEKQRAFCGFIQCSGVSGRTGAET